MKETFVYFVIHSPDFNIKILDATSQFEAEKIEKTAYNL